MVAPNDSVFNTRIDALPVHAKSSTWVSSLIAPVAFLPSWGVNVLDNTVPKTQMFFYYTNGENGSFQIAAWPNRKREGGAFPTDGNNDHHMVSVNHQTCQFYETYQEGNPNSQCSSCNANSGWQYASTSYTQPTGGTTDAAGLPLAPLTVHLSEVKAGADQSRDALYALYGLHLLRFFPLAGHCRQRQHQPECASEWCPLPAEKQPGSVRNLHRESEQRR